MKNNANDNFYHIGRAAQLLDDLYDIHVDVRKVREAAPRVLHNTGASKFFTYFLRTRIKDYKVILPCEVDIIISVTGDSVKNHWIQQLRSQRTLFQHFNFSKDRVTVPIGDPLDPDAFIEFADWTEVESEDVLIKVPEGLQYLNKPHAYFEDFTLDGKILSFNSTNRLVDIIFEKQSVDENGFPYLPEKSIFALVNYMVYLDQLKKFYKKEGNANAVAIAKDEYDRSVAQARSPEQLTDNQSNEIMRTLLSKSRHNFGNPFKG